MILINMTNNEVVEKMAREGMVRKIINKVTDNGSKALDPSSLGDLENDIYLSLLEDEKLVAIYEQKHLNFYVARIVMNNIASSSSRYYRTYILPRKRDLEIIDAIIKEPGGEED